VAVWGGITWEVQSELPRHCKKGMGDDVGYETTIGEGAGCKVYRTHSAGIDYNTAPGIIMQGFFC